jgi:hypothetical protein
VGAMHPPRTVSAEGNEKKDPVGTLKRKRGVN